MIADLNNEQKEVLSEFIEYVKDHSGIITVNMMRKRKLYDHKYGKGEAIELLNEHFYELIEKEPLTDKEISQLAKLVLTRERKWVLEDEENKINANQVAYDGHDFARLRDGTRIDGAADLYHDERVRYNEKRTQRLKNVPTNGKEFLK